MHLLEKNDCQTVTCFLWRTFILPSLKNSKCKLIWNSVGFICALWNRKSVADNSHWTKVFERNKIVCSLESIFQCHTANNKKHVWTIGKLLPVLAKLYHSGKARIYNLVLCITNACRGIEHLFLIVLGAFTLIRDGKWLCCLENISIF